MLTENLHTRPRVELPSDDAKSGTLESAVGCLVVLVGRWSVSLGGEVLSKETDFSVFVLSVSSARETLSRLSKIRPRKEKLYAFCCNHAYRFPSFLGTELGTNLSPNLGIPQICPQMWGHFRPQIWGFPKFVPKFWDKFVPKFHESSNLSPNLRTISSPNLVNPQILGQIRPQLFQQLHGH